MNQGALHGVRVLDFSRVLAGPMATMILGDLGAEVIKIERPVFGDDTRAWGPPYVGHPDEGMSAYYLSINRNKHSVTLDLKQEAGRRIANELAQQSDVLVENFKVGQMASFSLGYDDLMQINRRLVYCSITGFGQVGTNKDYPGYDYVIQAMSGLMSITGAVESKGEKVGVALVDVMAGLNAVNAIVAALRHAERTGEGQYIDIALLNTQLASLVNVASNYLVSGETPARYGNQHPNIVPYQTFEARDGSFVCAVGNDHQFRTLCRLIGREDWIIEPRFATNSARVVHRDALIKLLSAIFSENTVTYWVGLLLDAGIPAGRIQTVGEALENAQIAGTNLIETWRLQNGATVRGVGSPLKMSLTPPKTVLAPPILGQDTEKVLKQLLHYDDHTIATLRSAGVI